MRPHTVPKAFSALLFTFFLAFHCRLARSDLPHEALKKRRRDIGCSQDQKAPDLQQETQRQSRYLPDLSLWLSFSSKLHPPTHIVQHTLASPPTTLCRAHLRHASRAAAQSRRAVSHQHRTRLAHRIHIDKPATAQRPFAIKCETDAIQHARKEGDEMEARYHSEENRDGRGSGAVKEGLERQKAQALHPPVS
eukprot:3673663-Rhodomonas_salina.1